MNTSLNNSENILVAYFSWSGNTHEIATQINMLVGGDIYRIQPVNEYSAVYRDVLARAKQEIGSADKPELTEKPETIEQYDIIFIGYPNWCNTFPAPVLSFLSEYDFTGKKIVPFCTHGGGGNGHSVQDIAKQCPEAEILNSFSINGYAVGNNHEELNNWIRNIKF